MHPSIPKRQEKRGGSARPVGRSLAFVALALALTTTALAGCLQAPEDTAPRTGTPPGAEDRSDATPLTGPESEDGEWPHEGSFATYRVETAGGAPDGTFEVRLNATVTFTFRDGAWKGTCEGTRQAFQDGVADEPTRVETPVLLPPPHVTPNPDGSLMAHVLSGCGSLEFPVATAGTPGEGSATDACNCHAADATWDPQTALVTSWTNSGSGSGVHGELVDTDRLTSA